MENLKLYDFLEEISRDNGEWSQLEIINYLEKISSNYDIKKLVILKHEIEFFISLFLENLETEYGEEKINESYSNYEDIPKCQTEHFTYLAAKKKGEPLDGIPRYYPPRIDYELVFAHELFALKRVQSFVESKLSEKGKIKSKKNEQSISSTSTLSALETAYLVYYLIKSKDYIPINGIPGELDWKHFSEMTNGKSPTNIRKSYNEINLKDDKRLKSSRTVKIAKVISYLKENLPQYGESILKAEQELHLAERNIN